MVKMEGKAPSEEDGEVVENRRRLSEWSRLSAMVVIAPRMGDYGRIQIAFKAPAHRRTIKQVTLGVHRGSKPKPKPDLGGYGLEQLECLDGALGRNEPA